MPLVLVGMLISCFCYAQDAAESSKQSISKNTLFVEGMGNSLVYGLNYDRILINKEKWKFTGRLGFSYFYQRHDQYSIFNFPSEFSFLIGKSKNFFETGVGATYYFETIPQAYASSQDKIAQYAYLFTRLGYRYQRPQGGFFLKAGLNIVFPLTEDSKYVFLYSEFIWIYGGVGIGYTFKPKKNK